MSMKCRLRLSQSDVSSSFFEFSCSSFFPDPIRYHFLVLRSAGRLLSELSRVDRAHDRVVNTFPNAAMFMLIPRFKVNNVGEPIRLNDQVSLH